MDQIFLDLLIEQLPELEPGRRLDETARRYAAYYGIDFSDHIPQHLGRIQVDEFAVAVQVWLPPQARGTLVILHGYYDHMGLYRHLISWALQHGLAVLAFDLPGHGLSSGERASIECFTHYQRVLDEVLTHASEWGLPTRWHLLGQSTGGAIVIDKLLHGPLPEELGRTVLMAPLVRPRKWGLSQVSLRLLGGFVQQLGRRFTDNSTDQEFLDFIRERDPLQPQVLPVAWVQALEKWIPRIEQAQPSDHSPLVIQGHLDRTVNWRHNMRIIEEKFENPKIFFLPEARHHLANEGELIRRQYLAWLAHEMEI